MSVVSWRSEVSKLCGTRSSYEVDAWTTLCSVAVPSYLPAMGLCPQKWTATHGCHLSSWLNCCKVFSFWWKWGRSRRGCWLLCVEMWRAFYKRCKWYNGQSWNLLLGTSLSLKFPYIQEILPDKNVVKWRYWEVCKSMMQIFFCFGGKLLNVNCQIAF